MAIGAAERAQYQTWVGRSETARDIVTDRLVQSFTATLESGRHFPHRQGQLPLTLHWCLTPPIVPMSGLGSDGHPAGGTFLPFIPDLPRRMWAGGELEMLTPLAVGDAIERVSSIAGIDFKEGHTGLLCFVRIDHAISTPRGPAIRERQDIVYRAPAGPAAAATGDANETKPRADHSLTLYADPVLLFRYSALTFNGHRIHYDRTYVTGAEQYDGLVVHGPLQASFLAEFAAELAHGKSPRKLAFRGIRPLFDGAQFSLKAQETEDGMALWVEDAACRTTMKAKVSW